MIPHDAHLEIGSLVFEGMDQIDLTGPFEVLPHPQLDLSPLWQDARPRSRHQRLGSGPGRDARRCVPA